MKHMALIIGLMLAPTGLSAQGLPVDFDADFFENDAPRQDIEPAAADRRAEATPARRAIRHGERTVLVDRERTAPAPQPVVARSGS